MGMDKHTATEQAYKNGYADGMPKWIPVTERLPEDFIEVLVFGRSKLTRVMVIDVAFRKGRKWFVPCDEDGIESDPVIVSHWMPLPEPPKGE